MAEPGRPDPPQSPEDAALAAYVETYTLAEVSQRIDYFRLMPPPQGMGPFFGPSMALRLLEVFCTEAGVRAKQPERLAEGIAWLAVSRRELDARILIETVARSCTAEFAAEVAIGLRAAESAGQLPARQLAGLLGLLATRLGARDPADLAGFVAKLAELGGPDAGTPSLEAFLAQVSEGTGAAAEAREAGPARQGIRDLARLYFALCRSGSADDARFLLGRSIRAALAAGEIGELAEILGLQVLEHWVTSVVLPAGEDGTGEGSTREGSTGEGGTGEGSTGEGSTEEDGGLAWQLVIELVQRRHHPSAAMIKTIGVVGPVDDVHGLLRALLASARDEPTGGGPTDGGPTGQLSAPAESWRDHSERLIEVFADSYVPERRETSEVIDFLGMLAGTPAGRPPAALSGEFEQLRDRLAGMPDRVRLQHLLTEWSLEGEPLQSLLAGFVRAVVETSPRGRGPAGPRPVGDLIEIFETVRRHGAAVAVRELARKAAQSVRGRTGAELADMLARVSVIRGQSGFPGHQAHALIGAFGAGELEAAVLADYVRALQPGADQPRWHRKNPVALACEAAVAALLDNAAGDSLSAERVAELALGMLRVEFGQDEAFEVVRMWLEQDRTSLREPQDAVIIFRRLREHWPAERGALEQLMLSAIAGWRVGRKQRARELLAAEH